MKWKNEEQVHVKFVRILELGIKHGSDYTKLNRKARFTHYADLSGENNTGRSHRTVLVRP